MRGTQAQEGPLLEREGELERIRAALDAASGGSGGLVTIAGAAGVGKSTLLRAAEREAEARGFLVLGARGDDLERAFPFGVAIQLFGEAAAREPGAFAGAAELARPLLERAEPVAPPGDPDPAFPLLHGLHWLAANLAERTPLALSVDDLQWADPPSLRYLLYLLGRSGGLPVLLCAAERTGEVLDPGVEKLSGRLREAGATIELAPLGRESVRRIVLERLRGAGEGVVGACLEATGGNPFLLKELLKAAAEEGSESAEDLRAARPASIRSAILVRLGRLGEKAAALARAAAVAGPGAPLEVLAELAALEPGAAGEAADALATAEILHVAGGEASFVHPVLRGAVHEDLGAATRERMHAGAARILHRRGAPATRIAAHLMLCPPVGEDWVVPMLREAARREAGAGATRAAADHMGRALAEPGYDGDPELLTELGTAEMALGDPAAPEHLEAAAAAAEDPGVRAMALGGLGMARYLTGDPAGAVEASRKAVNTIPPGSGGMLEAQLLRSFALAGRAVPEAVPSVREVLSLSRTGEGDDRPPLAEAVRLGDLAISALLEGHRDVAIRSARTVLGWVDEERIGPDLPPLTVTLPALALAFAGLVGEAEPALDRAVADAQRQGSHLGMLAALEARIALRLSVGDLRGVLADSEILLGLSDAWDVATIPVRVGLVEALLDQGRVEQAAASLRLPEGLDDAPPGSWGYLWLPRGRSRIAFARGDWREALDHALSCGERLEEIEATNPDYIPWRSMAARAADRLGEVERARALAAEEVKIAREIGSPRATGVALMALGTVLSGSEGIDALEEAVALLDGTRAELEQARGRLELGMAIRRAGRPREARAHLRQAADRARRLAATAIVERGLEELRAAGARPDRVELTGPESLTPSELRVAELAADNRSNREIAESLFVSLRTVETHLTHAYRKLGIGSREDLRATLSP